MSKLYIFTVIILLFCFLVIQPQYVSENDFIKHPNNYNNKLTKNVFKISQFAYCDPKNIKDKNITRDLMYEKVENINSSIKDVNAYVGIISGVNRFKSIFN